MKKTLITGIAALGLGLFSTQSFASGYVVILRRPAANSGWTVNRITQARGADD